MQVMTTKTCVQFFRSVASSPKFALENVKMYSLADPCGAPAYLMYTPVMSLTRNAQLDFLPFSQNALAALNVGCSAICVKAAS